jgi:polysaccharide deacetylase family protein (PEP-CTERM system associated)
MLEIPITTLNLGGKNIPIGGGGYFRFFPYTFTKWGLRRINRIDKRPFVFYLHPWEIDPDQPRMPGIGLKTRFRHYVNLGKTEQRFRNLLSDFKFSSMRNLVSDYFS